jgi:hypothetical protein
MVLGGQPPGRVGRRRSFLNRPSGAVFFCPDPGKARDASNEREIVIGAIILGILAGYLARLLMPGRQDIG